MTTLKEKLAIIAIAVVWTAITLIDMATGHDSWEID